MTTHLTAAPTAVTLTADALDLREAVLGEGLVLTTSDAYVLHTVAAGRAAFLGRYTDVRDAWAAVDALDGFTPEPAAAALAA